MSKVSFVRNAVRLSNPIRRWLIIVNAFICKSSNISASFARRISFPKRIIWSISGLIPVKNPINARYVQNNFSLNSDVELNLFKVCGRCFGRQNHLKRHVESVHKNAILTNIVSIGADGVKIEPQTNVKKEVAVPVVSSSSSTVFQIKDVVVSNSANSVPYKSISIITSNAGAAETAALGLVSIGNFDAGNTGGLESQSIIVENIDLDALNTASFVTTADNNHILN